MNTIEKDYPVFIKVSEKDNLEFAESDISKLEKFNTPAGTSPFYCRGFVTFEVAVIEPKGDYFLGLHKGRIFHGSNYEYFACSVRNNRVPHDWGHLVKDFKREVEKISLCK